MPKQSVKGIKIPLYSRVVGMDTANIFRFLMSLTQQEDHIMDPMGFLAKLCLHPAELDDRKASFYKYTSIHELFKYFLLGGRNHVAMVFIFPILQDGQSRNDFPVSSSNRSR